LPATFGRGQALEQNAVKRLSNLLLLAALLLGLVTAGQISPAAAQTAGENIEMEAQAAFGGYVKNGEWLPLWVTLENRGADLEGELRVRITSGSGATNYSVPVPLPAGARKRVPLYVVPNSFSRQMEVQLFSGEELIKSATVDVQPQMNISYLVGVLAPERGAMGLISGINLPGQNRPVSVVDLAAEDLPERVEGLVSFDTILINDFDTSQLSQGQVQALANWVQSGGRLVLGGGAGAQKTLSGLPEDLVPRVSDNLQELEDISELAVYAGADPVEVPGPFLAATPLEAGTAALVSQDGAALLTETHAGSGFVNYSALDLASSPYSAWTGTTPFWEKMLSPGSIYPNWLAPDVSPRQMMSDQMNYALSSLPALDLPSVRGLALLLFVYVMLVGPVNYVVLRWKKRLHWAWVTIPAITILFSVGTFALGFALRGNDVILNKITVLQMQPDGTGRTTSYYGLFSPAQRAYEVDVAGSGLLSPMIQYYDPWSGAPVTGSELTFVQSDPGVVRGLSINQWSMQSFQGQGVWNGIGQITSDLQATQDGISGTIQNDTPFTIEDVRLVVGTRFAKLDTLAPGEQREVTLAMPEETGFQYSGEIGWLLYEQEYAQAITPPRELDVRRTLITSVFQNGAGNGKPTGSQAGMGSLSMQPVLLGWIDESPSDVRVNDRSVTEQATTLIYQGLPYELGDGEQVSLPVGMIPGGLVAYPLEGGTCGADTRSVWLGRGEALFEFQVPEMAREVQLDELRLSIRSDGGWVQLPEVAVYDWQADAWARLQGAATGINVLSEATRYVDENGNIQVRLTSENNMGGGCLYVDLGLQGTRQ
jgi:hypothetical protein